ncbi:amidohydrolase family protein [Pseudoalteromonas sp. B193]
MHPQSVDAFFKESQKRNLRMIAGKVMMDRNCPDDLSDCAQTSYDESKALIEKWHNVDRLSYAVTPRFAPTSTLSNFKNVLSCLKNTQTPTCIHTYLKTKTSANG